MGSFPENTLALSILAVLQQGPCPAPRKHGYKIGNAGLPFQLLQHRFIQRFNLADRLMRFVRQQFHEAPVPGRLRKGMGVLHEGAALPDHSAWNFHDDKERSKAGARLSFNTLAAPRFPREWHAARIRHAFPAPAGPRLPDRFPRNAPVTASDEYSSGAPFSCHRPAPPTTALPGCGCART